ncbi:TIGR04255 family protein [Thalassoporum mexicanum]|uniref:TIGR04255 family protein n=1 Tax=Thalassoporum mexicanum TaxID=3457544 RepID=UPI0018DC3FE4|nr:TIGR04255 family protein [Pseudanabaena sp. PCC 7367]
MAFNYQYVDCKSRKLPSHIAWKSPPLQEALLEIRFEPVNDYAIYAGGMALGLKEDFPISEKLAMAEFPGLPPGIVMHRFFNEEKSLLFQTGNDILSVNSTNYKGFNLFVESIRNVLTNARKFVSSSKINRLGLRYINNLSKSTNPLSTLNVNLPFEHIDINRSKEILFRQVSQEDNEIILSVNVSSSEPTRKLILDIDAFHFPDNIDWDIDLIVGWIDTAHEAIYANFEKLVSPEEKEIRK